MDLIWEMGNSADVFFDADQRLDMVPAKGDPLMKIKDFVPWPGAVLVKIRAKSAQSGSFDVFGNVCSVAVYMLTIIGQVRTGQVYKGQVYKGQVYTGKAAACLVVADNREPATSSGRDRRHYLAAFFSSRRACRTGSV